jgi:class III poly(R)-hydroxyalkanoic acid synthase PhaE subunit
MNERKQENNGPKTLIEAWVKSASDFWGSVMKAWPIAETPSKEPLPPKKSHKTRVQESMESALRTWQTLSSIMTDPGVMENLSKGINTLPEIFVRTVQTGWERYFSLQQQWLERTAHLGKHTEAYKFEDIDQDALKAWTDIYEKEFRKFLNVPQLGLTRFYQERSARMVDKFNLFEGAMGEFLYLIYLPMEKSFKIMRDKLEELTREEKLPESSQEYYRIWLKILEGHYMILFKSSEYTKVMGKALDAMEEFLAARQEFFQDIFQTLPVPTNKDMDDLYKELYQLKKRIKRLENKQKDRVPKVS